MSVYGSFNTFSSVCAAAVYPKSWYVVWSLWLHIRDKFDKFDAYSFGLFTNLNCGCQTPLQFSVCGCGNREIARIAMAAYIERTEIDCN